MNIVILVSVLCTLGVVAIVGAIVVAFMKLNRKVDDKVRDVNDNINIVNNDFQDNIRLLKIEMEEIVKDIFQNFDNKDRDLDEKFKTLYNEIKRGISDVDRRFDETYRFVDSRCDKLDNKICGKNCKCNPTKKQLLTD